jgi:hypothetical protein
LDATAQQEFPGCEAWLGPGNVGHPEFPTTCCHPGHVPVPGQAVCVKPGSPAYHKYFGNPGDGSGGPQIFDAEGRPGAPGAHCIPLNLSCTLGGAPCCEGTCQGTFPNTVCR